MSVLDQPPDRSSEEPPSSPGAERRGAFDGARVLAFESRRAREMGELIRINGGRPLLAPALVEVPLEQNTHAFEFAGSLHAGDFDMVIFLTGVGARHLGSVVASVDGEESLREDLRRVTVVARGPKPTAVLRDWNVPVAVQVPEPNTWRELLSVIEALPGRRVAVQEYGVTNHELLDGLKHQGRSVTLVPVYRWALPDNTKPLDDAVSQLLAGEVDVALFTTGVQIEHVLQFAARTGRWEAVREALSRLFVASIGPTCSEALQAAGLTPALEPSHPKMGVLVREAAAAFRNRQ